MGPLLSVSHAIDVVNRLVSRLAVWAVLVACVVSAGNAAIRYLLSYSSNAWLEVQWYLFTVIVMLGAGYTLLRNEHVRVDLVYGNLPPRARLWVDVVGLILFLGPAMALLAWMTWPFFLDSWTRQESSSNAGGLLRWPVKLILPIGFALIFLQGISELIKRIAALKGTRTGEVELVSEYVRPEQ
ncbi:TRAP transporter small permease subunit [Roseococcus pinisoli]|uniref:TRAP transporter small permease protein n=1 Tax=Roseococcus pinisoli TaxID=2835040 RepID=A0ABS5QEN8_9PROT|nr:TRAP transporter small permease subunit [Roseococcus pinisoli]MBS7812160.1 TRAP transporter small permease subunit [Roseococcus pinisoli]